MQRQSHFLVILVMLILAAPAVFADYIDVSATDYANYSSNVTLKGYVKLDNSSAYPGVNVTVNLSGSLRTINTNSAGYFELNVTAPNATGDFNISILTNTSLLKSIETHVANYSSVIINFTEKRPPFMNGTSFLVSITFSGSSSSAPSLEIFSANGGNSSGWVINNMSSRVNANSIIYNITVPAAADGRYVMVFDEGAGATIFLVKSSLIVVAGVEDAANATTMNFAQGEPMQIEGKMRDASGPITSATLTAFITLPNGTIENTTLVHNLTGTDGTYTATFSDTALAGDYKIEIVANSSGRIIRSNSMAKVERLYGKLDVVKDFFFDFGSQSAFQKSGPVEFNVLVYNLSTDASSSDVLLNGSTGSVGTSDVNCNAISVAELKNTQNGSVLSSPAITKSTSVFMGQVVCKINFTAPGADAVYSISVNASIGTSQNNNISVTATGYFAIQSYMLKPSPVSSFGGGNDFMSFLMPGDNATFELSVRNLSNGGNAVAGNLITNFNVTKIMPMSFTGGGQSEITSVQVISYTNGTASANPRLILKVPENTTGPFQVEFQATVAGSVIKGTAFYVARYVDGFTFPSSFGGGFGTGGPGGEGPSSGGGGGPGGPGEPGGSMSGGNFKCSGLQNFSAVLKDVRTNQAARNVVFNSIQEAREEMTGRDVSGQIALSSSTSTDSNGFGNLTLNFSGSMSGFYFMLINITTSDGKTDALPGGFECRQISFFPQVQAIGSTGGGFSVAPSSGVNIIVSGAKNLVTGSSTVNGTVKILRIESYSPTSGPKIAPGLVDSFPIINGLANITLYPSNFTSLGGKWFNGFNNLAVQLCDNNNNTNAADDVCDTGFGGFQVVAFDAFFDYSSGSPMQTISANTTAIYSIMAKTNVTNFSVQIGMPWEGSLLDAVVNNYSLVSDGWNSSADSMSWNGFERWNVNFTVPESIRKGGNMITFKVTNYLGESTDVMTFATASKMSVVVPDTEGLNLNMGAGANITINQQVADFLSSYSVNLMLINDSYNIKSKSGFVCVKPYEFSTTRYGMFSQNIVYSNVTNTSAFMVDNTTAGVYDTLVVSVNSSRFVGIVSANNRSLASAGFGNLYFIKSQGCGFAELANSQLNGTGYGAGYGGAHQVNTTAIIPIIVRRGGASQAGIVMNVSQVIKQQDVGESRGGFGFTGMLDSGDFSSVAATTDSNGVAFLNVSIHRSGFYSILWSFNNSGDTDIADFSEGIPIEIKNFQTDGGVISGGTLNNHPMPFRVVTLNKILEDDATYINATKSGYYFYLGTWNESTQGVFINDFNTNYHYIVLRNVTQQGDSLREIPDFSNIVIDNNKNFNFNSPDSDGFTPVSFNWTDKSQLMYDMLAVVGNLTVDENTTKLEFANTNGFPNAFISNMGNSNRVYVNVTVKACANTFSQPQTPLINANVSGVVTQSFTPNGPPTNENLTMFDPFTGATVTSVLTGPSGCAVFNVTRSSGWTSGMPNQVQGTITYGGNSEQTFMGSISVSCPYTGPCF